VVICPRESDGYVGTGNPHDPRDLTAIELEASPQGENLPVASVQGSHGLADERHIGLRS
jgi:hypothetical protein